MVLLFVVFFKVADTILNIMTMPFLIELGFSKLEIANVAKTFGIAAMIFGGIFAGVYLTKYNLYRLLLLCAIAQLGASVLFIIQAKLGHNLGFLFLTMGVENVTCGMGQVALITYFSKLCDARYTATHYALLSSFASLIRVKFSSVSGAIADAVAWQNFYFIVALSSIPCFIILWRQKRFFVALD
jgi:PAT family beta-lactamase induction signal transducer AmpG